MLASLRYKVMVGMEGVVVISVIFAIIPCARGRSQGIMLFWVKYKAAVFISKARSVSGWFRLCACQGNFQIGLHDFSE